MRREGVQRERPERALRVLPSSESVGSQILRSVDEGAACGQQSSKLVVELISAVLAQPVWRKERVGEPGEAVVPRTERGSQGLQVVASVGEVAFSSRRKQHPLSHRAEVPNQVGGSMTWRRRLEACNDVGSACRPRAARARWPRQSTAW